MLSLSFTTFLESHCIALGVAMIGLFSFLEMIQQKPEKGKKKKKSLSQGHKPSPCYK